MGEKEVVTMCITNGVWILGRLFAGGPKLLEPRLFKMFEVQKKEKVGENDGKPVFKYLYYNDGEPIMEEKINLKPMPSIPAFINVPPGAVTYPITSEEMNVLGLYKRTTVWGKSQAPTVIPGKVEIK